MSFSSVKLCMLGTIVSLSLFSPVSTQGLSITPSQSTNRNKVEAPNDGVLMANRRRRFRQGQRHPHPRPRPPRRVRGACRHHGRDFCHP
ncbi:MAG: hypothetical protein AB4041_03535 [Microcystaceae cyanobacterium]